MIVTTFTMDLFSESHVDEYNDNEDNDQAKQVCALADFRFLSSDSFNCLSQFIRLNFLSKADIPVCW